MKRLFAIIAAALFAVSAFARNISESEALKQASEFFGNVPVSNLEIVWTGSSSSTPSFYAINNSKGGFVLISGTDNINPVLGYAYDRKFTVDNMPAHVASWFGGMEKSIKEIEKKNIRINEADRGMFNMAGPRTKGFNSAKLMTTAEWNQGSPYNDDCNLGGGLLGVTGCVATAMAITLRYHQHPAKGTGTLASYTTPAGYKISGYSLESHKYDWNSMPLKDSDVKNGTAAQKAQIAQLMHDCGVMVKMQYTPSSSGAFSQDILPALVEHMGYDKSSRFAPREAFSTSEWINLLKSSISNDCPVIYGSQSSIGGGGHQFVLDGFDDKGNFHVNWGWGGSDNGYFTVELEVNGYAFNSASDALLNLHPKTGGDSPTPTVFALFDAISVTKGDICSDSEFTLSFKVINDGVFTATSKIQPAVIDRNGKIKEMLAEPEELELEAYYIATFSDVVCKLSAPAEPTDRLVITYTDEKGNVAILPYTHDGKTSGSLIFQPYTFIKLNPAGYKVGDLLEFDLLSNKSISSVEWKFDGQVVSMPSPYVVLATAGKHTLEAKITYADEHVETVVQEVDVK